MRRLWRWTGGMVRGLIGPWGRRLGAVGLATAAWLWWAWTPLRPIAIWTSSQTDSNWNPTWPRISRDGSTFVEISDQLPFGTDPFANGSMARPVWLWDLPAGRERVSIPGFDKAQLRAILGPDGSWVMIWTPFHRGLTLWDGRTGKLLAEMRPPDAPDGNVIVPTPFLASDDGKFVACGIGLKPSAVRVWETATGRLAAEFVGARPPFAFSPDGRRVLAATAGENDRPGTVAKLWDIASGRELFSLAGHRWPLGSVAFSPDGRLLATGLDSYFHSPESGDEFDVKLWDAATGRPMKSFSVKAGLSLAFSPDSRLLLVWGMRARGLVWDITQTPPRNRDDLNALAEQVVKGTPQLSSFYGPHYAPAGKAWYVTNEEGTEIAAAGEPTESPRLLALPSIHGIGSHFTAGAYPQMPVFSPGGRVLAVPAWADVPHFRRTLGGLIDRFIRRRVGSEPWSTVRLFDPATGRVLGTLPNFGGECYVLGFTPDEQTFWTERFVGDRNGPRSAMTRVFAQWAVPEPAIPACPIAATVGGMAFIALDWRRASAANRRYNLAQGASPG